METFGLCFEKTEDETKGRYLRITEIVQILNNRTSMKLDVRKLKTYCMELRQEGFMARHMRMGTSFLVKFKDMSIAA